MSWDLLISFISVTDKCYQMNGFYQNYLTSNIVDFVTFPTFNIVNS